MNQETTDLAIPPKPPIVKFFAAKRNGDAGQQFGVAYMVQIIPIGATIYQGPYVMVETDGHWKLIDLVHRQQSPEGFDKLNNYFWQRVALGWFLEVDHPYSQEATLWRLTSDSEEQEGPSY